MPAAGAVLGLVGVLMGLGTAMPAAHAFNGVALGAPTELRASNARPGAVLLDWVTPADGATRYELRYSAAPITSGNWPAATVVDDVPKPSAPGVGQALDVEFSSATGRRYFRLRAVDAAGNASALSNEVSAWIPAQTFYGGYRTTGQLYLEMKALEARFPALVQVIDYGDSYALRESSVTDPGGEEVTGYDLWALRITNRDIVGDKPKLTVLGALHAREIVVPEVAMRLANTLLEGHGEDADLTWLVDTQETWIIPVSNPDGRAIVERGARSGGRPWVWRKNANQLDSTRWGCTWPPAQTQHGGVDLNRNFDWFWDDGETNGCSQYYRGRGPFSEPEAAAARNLLKTLHPEPHDVGTLAPIERSGVFLDLHSNFAAVMWPWGHSDEAPANEPGLSAMGEKMAAMTGYQSGRVGVLIGGSYNYTVPGSAVDWAYASLGIASYVFEVSGVGPNQGFHPSYDYVDDTLWPGETREALLYAIKMARAPYLLSQGPVSGEVVTGPTSTAQITLTAAFHDEGDQVMGARYFRDIPPWQGGGAIPMQSVDGAFGEAREVATATFAAASLGAGANIVYVQGVDAEGYWGEVTAHEIEATTPPPPPPPTGAQLDRPLSYYAFDEGAGSDAVDSSGNAHPPGRKSGGIEESAGVSASALGCDGLDDHVRVPGVAAPGGEAFTVGFWFNDESTAGDAYEYLLSLGSVGQRKSLNVYFCEDGTGCAGKLRTLYIGRDDTTGFSGAMDVAGLADGQWHHYALRVGPDQGAEVFIDGVRRGARPPGGVSSLPSAGELFVCGRTDHNAARFYEGQMDELVVYDGVLDDEAIETLSIPPSVSGQGEVLIGHWRFDEPGGTVAADSADGSGNDGVRHGAIADVASVNGRALACDGVNDRVNIGTPGALGGDAMTVSFDFRDDSTAGPAYEYLLSLGTVAQRNSLNVYFCENGTGCAGKLRTLFKGTTDAPGFSGAIDVAGLADGQWHRYTLRYDRAGAVRVQVFIDGELAGQQAALGRGGFVPASELNVCARNDRNAARYYEGQLDELRVYDQALSLTDIATGPD